MPARTRIVAPRVGRNSGNGNPKKPPPKPTIPVQISTEAVLDARIAEVSGDVFDSPFEAYQLRLKGVAWPDVAKRCGYGSANSAAMAVSVYLQKAALAQSSEHLQEALQLQIGRYETVLREWWDLGTTGHDEKAALIVLRALERLDRVQRLTEGDTVITKETLVISSDPEAYVEQLKAAAAEQDARR